MSLPLPAVSVPAPEPWGREVLGGSIAALVTLALLLSLGVLAFSPLGDEAVRVGAAAAFTTSAVSGLIYALGAASRLPTGAPTAPSTVIVASLVGGLLLDPALQAAPASAVGWVMAAVGGAVVLMGMMQLAIASLGLVQLVRNVPQTVLAGFLNAIAMLVLLAQFGPLLGFSSSALARQGTAALAQFRPGSLLLGLGTAALVWGLLRTHPRWPAALIALVAGTAVYQLLLLGLPGPTWGPTLGAISHDLPVTVAWAAISDAGGRDFLARHALTILGTAAAMAVVGVLESMLVVLALDQQFGDRSDARRELASIGAANLIGGLCGALPLGTVRSRAVAVQQGGGRGRRAAAATALASGMLFWIGSPLLHWLPAAVLGGIMLTVAWALVDPWTRSLVARWRAGERAPALGISLGVVAFVMLATVWRGPLFGVGLGSLLAAVLFMRQLSSSLVRSRYRAAEQPSRRVQTMHCEQRLKRLRTAISVLELEGALFFGNIEQLNQAAESMPQGTRVLVLDLRRVTTVDDTGAHGLAQLGPRLQRRGVRLLLAHVQTSQALGRRLHLFGVAGVDGVDWFGDADRAIDAAEQSLLADEDSPATLPLAERPAVPPEANALLADLDAADIERLRHRLQPLRLAAGEAVFRRGDPGDAVYLVTRGSVSIVAPGDGDRPPTRYASLSPGTLFGEAAVLDGGGRTADAVADSDTELLRLDASALLDLAATHPELGTRLYRNMARYLAQRLRIASAAWAAAAG